MFFHMDFSNKLQMNKTRNRFSNFIIYILPVKFLITKLFTTIMYHRVISTRGNRQIPVSHQVSHLNFFFYTFNTVITVF